MPLYIKDDETAALVARLARLHGLSKQGAVKLAAQAALEKAAAQGICRRPTPNTLGGQSAAAWHRQTRRQDVFRRTVRRTVTLFANASTLISIRPRHGRRRPTIHGFLEVGTARRTMTM